MKGPTHHNTETVRSVLKAAFLRLATCADGQMPNCLTWIMPAGPQVGDLKQNSIDRLRSINGLKIKFLIG